MRRLITLLRATGLMGVDTHPAALAQSPIPGPVPAGGRVEVPEHGFALTFPDDWTIQELAPEDMDPNVGLPGVGKGVLVALSVSGSTERQSCGVVLDDPSMREERALLATLADGTHQRLLADPAFDRVERARITLPIGTAWRFDYLQDSLSVTSYRLRGHRGIYDIRCVTDDPPADRWLSIAETFEFLPDPVTGLVPANPVLGGGRIERPAEGFAVTFPDDWTVELVSPPTQDVLLAQSSPDARAQRTIVLWADPPDHAGECIVTDITRLAEASPSWTSIEEAAWWLLSQLAADPNVVESKSDFVDLPAGRTLHVTAIGTDGWTRDTHVFTDAGTWFYLECLSPDLPDKGWPSIAETFQFLPNKNESQQ